MRTVKIILENKEHGHMARVVDAETGELIKGVIAVDVHLEVGAKPYADLRILYPEVEVTVDASGGIMDIEQALKELEELRVKQAALFSQIDTELAKGDRQLIWNDELETYQIIEVIRCKNCLIPHSDSHLSISKVRIYHRLDTQGNDTGARYAMCDACYALGEPFPDEVAK